MSGCVWRASTSSVLVFEQVGDGGGTHIAGGLQICEIPQRRAACWWVGRTDHAMSVALLVLPHHVVRAREDHTTHPLALGVCEDIESVRHGCSRLCIVSIWVWVDRGEVDDGVGAAEGGGPCAGAVGEVAEHNTRAGGHTLCIKVVRVLEENDIPLVAGAEQVRGELAAEIAALRVKSHENSRAQIQKCNGHASWRWDWMQAISMMMRKRRFYVNAHPSSDHDGALAARAHERQRNGRGGRGTGSSHVDARAHACCRKHGRDRPMLGPMERGVGEARRGGIQKSDGHDCVVDGDTRRRSPW